MTAEDREYLLCHRCGRTLEPGRGNFYVVRIEAFADPSPPVIREEDLPAEPADRLAEVLSELEGRSERELMDQIYRRVTLHLCGRCYGAWIEDPAGQEAPPNRGGSPGESS